MSTLSVLGFTLSVAAGSTLLILLPGLLVAWALSTPHWRGRLVLETLVSLPLVLPPTAVGLGLLFLVGRRGPIGSFLATLGIEVAFTWKAVVLACAVVSFPLLVRAIRGALEEVDPRLVGLARSLGRTPWQTFLEVQVPLAWRGLAAGAVLAFARSLGEFGATVLVAGNIPGRTQTLALAIFQSVQTGRDREALVMAALSVLLAFGCLLGVDVVSRRRERRLSDHQGASGDA